MRVSLYKHELEIISSLTVQLARMSHLEIENTGPAIFEKLVDVLYSRGNYKTFADAAALPRFNSIDNVDFSEVPR